MYKIFINEYPIIITANEDDFFKKGNYRIVGDSKEELLAARETLETSRHMLDRFGLLCLTQDEDAAFNNFTSDFSQITAAGGMVYNENKELLLIRRQGMWDLPKGKQDPGERIETTAVREVQEECGIRSLRLLDFLDCSYHTYSVEEERILKTTFWYKMEALNYTHMSPQLEENITELKWFDPKGIDLSELETYNSIRDLLNRFMER